MIDIERIFFVKQLKDGDYLIYNSIKHIPVKVDNTGKTFFDLILKNSSLNKCLQYVEPDKKQDFTDFYKALKKIKFFSSKEDIIDKDIFLSEFDEYKKTFYLHLTNRCNLNCTYCYNKNSRLNFKDLCFKEWKIILDKIIPYSKSFILTGGEAMLHPSFNDIVNYIKDYDKDIYIKLFSNCSHDYEKLELLKDTLGKVQSITLSDC